MFAKRRCRRIKSIASFGLVTAALSVAAINDAKAQFTFASDSSANSAYSDGWTGGDNGGSGFNSWTLASGAPSGNFAGNYTTGTANNGVSGFTGGGAFMQYAKFNNDGVFANADRSLSSSMGIGDTFSFQWGVNFDANNANGAKGFSIYTGGTGGTQVVNVNIGSSATITLNTTNVLTAYGTSAMTMNLSRDSSSQLTIWTAAGRNGGAGFTNTLTGLASSAVDAFRFYTARQDDGDNRNNSFNNFSLTNSGVYSVSQTESRALTGSGNLVVSNNSTLTLSGDNTFNGTTTVQQGSTLELNATTGAAAGATTSISVGASTAKLLLSKSDQVNNSATVTLSGGTIERASGVSETFGALNLDGDSTLNFGSGTAGNLTFGQYEGNSGNPSNLLTVNNFFAGNTLVFARDLSSFISPTYSGTAFTSDYFNINSTSGGFTSNWNGSTFTITAIPEPSTYAAAAGLLAMFLWPVRRRMIKDIKSILGLRPTGRERIEAYRKA
jgi:autotransporter-associated beta strand protein